ncbi:MAG: ABC transporter permease [Dehalococcoidales bacterium]|nr:ABC transporter permease [Dehalococcoidales bacterium]
MKIFFELIKSNFRQLFRDKASLFFTFAFPIVFMVIFGLIWSGDNNFKANVGLVSKSSSLEAQAFSQAFHGIGAFKVEDGDLTVLLTKLKAGELRAVIVIPEDISAAGANGKTSDITLYYDPTNTTTAQVVLPVAAQVIEQVERMISRQPSVVQLTTQSIQSRQMRNIDYLVPGIVAMSLLSTGLFCAMPLIQQREKKILKRWSATPIHRSSIIYSQVIFRLVLGLAQTVLLIGIARLVFNVQMVGNWLQLAGFVCVGTLALISVGYVIASFVKTEEGAMPVIQLVQFPMMFLSGIFFPVEMMPGFMKPVIQAMPVTYLGDGLRQIMIEATPIHTMNINLLVLGGWLVVCLAVSVRYFRWE